MTEYSPKVQMDFSRRRLVHDPFISAFWPRGVCKACVLVHQSLPEDGCHRRSFGTLPFQTTAYMAYSKVPLLWSTWFITPFGGLRGELDDAPRTALEGADVGRTTWKAAAG